MRACRADRTRAAPPRRNRASLTREEAALLPTRMRAPTRARPCAGRAARTATRTRAQTRPARAPTSGRPTTRPVRRLFRRGRYASSHSRLARVLTARTAQCSSFTASRPSRPCVAFAARVRPSRRLTPTRCADSLGGRRHRRPGPLRLAQTRGRHGRDRNGKSRRRTKGRRGGPAGLNSRRHSCVRPSSVAEFCRLTRLTLPHRAQEQSGPPERAA